MWQMPQNQILVPVAMAAGFTYSTGRIRMATMVQSKVWVMAVAASMAVAACSKPPIICGDEISPKNATDAELQLVSIARDQAAGLCRQKDGGCDFSVYKTKAGRTVKVTRVMPYDGRCVSGFGFEKFYSFDESGRLESVINGL